MTRDKIIEELEYIINPSPYDSDRYYSRNVIDAERKLADKSIVVIKELQKEIKELKSICGILEEVDKQDC